MKKNNLILLIAFIVSSILLSPLYIGLFYLKGFPIYDTFIFMWSLFWLTIFQALFLFAIEENKKLN